MTISRVLKIDNISPSEIAREFCDMDADKQALFFNWVHFWSLEWKMPFCFQLQEITDSCLLENGGREIMRQIGEYAEDQDEL